MIVIEIYNNRNDWHKAVLSLVLGIYFPIVIISTWFKLSFFHTINFSFLKPSSITFFLNISVIIVIGLLSVYVAKEEYFRTYLTFILISFFTISVIGSIHILFGDGWLSLRTAASPWGTAGFVILFYPIVSLLIVIGISFVLLPTMKIAFFFTQRSKERSEL